MRVLLIDDDPVQRKMVRAWLEPMGFDVTAADGVIAGLECVARYDDVVVALVDWHMHPFSGLAFVAAVRSEPALASLPLIMLTAEDNPQRVAQAARKGINGYILKPLRHRVLVDKMEELGLVRQVDGTPRRHPRVGVPLDMDARPSVKIIAGDVQPEFD